MSQLSKIAVLFMACALSLSARTQVRGWCEQGNKTVVATGVSGAPKVQGSYPQCTVTVRISPAGALMAIFADDAGTVKANPFTAAVSGYYFFYVDNGKYDITLSGTVAPPFTLSDVVVTNVIGSAAVPTGVGVGNGTAWSGVVAASQLQHLRRKPNVTGTQYEFATEPTLVASDYNFPAQSPGTDLIAGNTLITLTPVPLGVNWNDAGNTHWLYVSGGTDAAGVCYILTAGPGNAVSGAATGTLTLTCAAQHRGAYTVGSATGGLQEAQQACGVGNSCEIKIDSLITLYAPVTALSSGRMTFTGGGREVLAISAAPTFLAGNLFQNLGSSVWTIRDMQINQAAGALTTAIYATNQTHVRTVWVNGGDYGIVFYGVSNGQIHNFIFSTGDVTFKAKAGIRLTGAPGFPCTNIFMSDVGTFGYPVTDANVLTAGLLMDNADGVWGSNVTTGGDAGFVISPPAGGSYVASVIMSGAVCDGPRNFCLNVYGVGPVGGVRFIGPHFHAQSKAAHLVVGLAYSMDSNIADFEITGGWIQGGDSAGVWIGNTGGSPRGGTITLDGVTIGDNNRGNHLGIPGVIIANGAKNLNIQNCPIGSQGQGHQYAGIAILGSLTDAIIAGNILSDNTFPLTIAGPLTNVVIGPNQGIDNVIGSVASGATIAMPIYPTFEVTGTTAITNITGGWEGREITLIFTNAAPAGVSVGTGAGAVARTQAAVQYQALPLVLYGTKWYASGLTGAITAGSTDTFTNKTLDVEATGNIITTVQKIWFEAVNCTGTTPSLNWDTIATLAPATACTAGTTNTGLIRGLASFSNAEISQMQTHFKLPGDWAGAIDLKFKWQTSATSGSVVWQAASICVADAEVDDVAWNTASTVTDVAKGTTLQTNDASITGLTTTGCAAGELLHLKVFRDPAHASDDLAAAADLIGVEVTTRRAQ